MSGLHGVGNAGQQAGQKATSAGKAAASAWSPSIAAAKAYRAQVDAVARRKIAVNGTGAASAWNPAISAVMRYRAQVDAVARRKIAVNGTGAASAWSPAISAVKSYKKAVLDAEAAQKSLAHDRALGSLAGPLRSSGRIATLNASLGVSQDAVHERAGNIEGALGSVRNTGLGIAAVGAGMGVVGASSLKSAGDMQMLRIAFTQMMGSAEAGEAKLQELAKFAASTPFELHGLAKNAQMMSAMGFKADELIPTLTALGNAMAATGQGEEVLNRVAQNLGQISNMEHPQAVDLKQFAYAGIDVKKAVSKGAGKEMSMDDIQDMSGKDFVKTFVAGLNKQFAGMMEQQNATLPGQISNLSDAFFQLKAALGGPLVPAATLFVKVLAAGANWFASWPGWMQGIVSWIGAVVAGILVLGGGVLALGAQMGMMALGAAALGITVTGAGISFGGAGIAIGAAGAAAGGATIGFGALAGGLALGLGAIVVATGGVVLAIAALLGGLYLLGKGAIWLWNKLTGLDQAKIDAGKKIDLERLKANNADRQKRGLAPQSLSEFVTGKEPGQEVTEEDLELAGYSQKEADDIDAKAQQAASKQQMADMQKQMAGLKSGTSAMPAISAASTVPATGAFQAVTGTQPSGGGEAAAEVARIDSQIVGLQRQIRNTKDKETKKALGDQLFEARLAAKHARATASAEKRAANEQERIAKKLADEQERIAKRKAKREDALQVYAGDIERAWNDEQTDTAIAQLEAQKTDDGDNSAIERQIEEVKARKILRDAELNAEDVADDDPQKANSILSIARIRARGVRERAALKKGKPDKFSEALSVLRNGGGMLGLMNKEQKKAWLKSYLKGEVELPGDENPLGEGLGGQMFNPYSTPKTYTDENGVAATGAFARTIALPQANFTVDSYGRIVSGNATAMAQRSDGSQGFGFGSLGDGAVGDQTGRSGPGLASNQREVFVPLQSRRQDGNGDIVFRFEEVRVPQDNLTRSLRGVN